MKTQLECLGFNFESEEELQKFFDTYWDRKTIVDMVGGLYLRLDIEDDIECWLSVDPDTQEILDWEMHYAGSDPLGCAFDGDYQLDEAGQSGNIGILLNPGENEIPLTLSCPVLAKWRSREAGSPGLCQAAFYALDCFDTDVDRAIVYPDCTDNIALLKGAVISSRLHRNSYTHKSFRTAVLDCDGVRLTVVFPPETPAELLSTGNTLQLVTAVTGICEEGISV